MRALLFRSCTRVVASVLLSGLVVVLLAGCPANGVKTFLMRTTDFDENIYVNGTTGDDENDGRIATPFATIQAAIDRGRWYVEEGGYAGVNVCVAAGTYEINDSEGNGITIVEGVSLYGGYSSDLLTRAPDTYETIIQDMSTTGEPDPDGGTEADNVAIVADGRESSITTATVIDGFTIIGGGTSDGSAYTILCQAASPTISNNVIEAGNGVMAMYISEGSSPVIEDNRIVGSLLSADVWGWKATILVRGDCEPVITGNEIEATGDATIGQTAVLVLNGSIATIRDNEITASTPSPLTYGATGIGVSRDGSNEGATAVIEGNTITAPTGVSSWDGGNFDTVRGNTIVCTNTAGPATGVEGSATAIRENTITCNGFGTDSDVTQGIATSGPLDDGSARISGNTIDVRDSGPTSGSWGISVQDANLVIIEDNRVSSGPADGVHGVIVFDTWLVDCQHNIITTTSDADTVFETVVYFNNTAGNIDHNLIAARGEFAPSTAAVEFGNLASGSDVRLWNNTIYAGGADESLGIRFQDCASSGRVESNIIFVGDGTGSADPQTAIVASGMSTPPNLTVRNNLFYRYDDDMVLYNDEGGDIDVVDDLEDYLDPLPSGTAEDNIDSSVDLDAGKPIFVDIDGNDGDITTFGFETATGNDWHLATGDDAQAAVYAGGRYQGATATDLDGVVRGTVWSIGAYEYDGP